MAADKQISVEIIVDNHSHQGQPCKKGDVISVTPDVAKWLLDGGKGKSESQKTKAQ